MKWKRNENTLNIFEKYYNFIIIFTVYCYLYLNVVLLSVSECEQV